MPTASRISDRRDLVRIGLVGVGGYGARHLHTMDFLPGSPGAELVAVADPFREHYPLLEDRLSAKGIRWHLSMEEMLETEQLDAVVIAAPIPRHFAMAKLVLEHGLHLYLEKPPVPLIQQLEELIALDTEHKVVVGFQLVHSEPIRQLKRLILDGKLGKILSIRGGASAPRRQSYYTRASWAGKMTMGGEPVFDGPMTNALAHILQNIMYLGSEADARFARPLKVRGELYRCAPIESYDSACIEGILDSGVEFAFAGSHATVEILPHTLEVRGTKTTVRLEGDRLLSPFPLSLETSKAATAPLEQSYHSFIDHLHQKDGAFAVRLEDTLGYTLATNGALVSSGGIHTIGDAHFRAYETNGDAGVDAAELVPLILRCIETGALFSESGPAWAAPTQSVNLRNFHSLVLDEWMSIPDQVAMSAAA